MEIILNDIKTIKDKTAGSVVINKKTYYVCSQCGRLSFRKIKCHKRVWCCKHYKQQKKNGECLDCNPRTYYDRNEIHIIGDTAYIYLYDKDCNHIATGICDAEDVEKIRYTKFVDHIDHNRLNNKKENLRIVTKSQNQMNVNYKGVTPTNNGKWYAHIKRDGKMLNLGVYVFEEEALFARWYAEVLVFKEFRYPKEKPAILPDREEQIKKYVEKKVQRL